MRKIIKLTRVDYEYIHIFNNKLLDLEYEDNGFEKNLILYILNSDFKYLQKIYQEKKYLKITDLFVQNINFTNQEFLDFFSYKFLGLFWLRLSNFELDNKDYLNLINFIKLNLLDLNRIYLENLGLDDEFLKLLSSQKLDYNIITFINLDNNNFSFDGFLDFTKFIKNNTINLEYLSISGCGIDLNLDFLSDLKYLKILDICGNKLDLENQNKLLNFINNSNSIKEIHIKNIDLDNEFLSSLKQIKNNNLEIITNSISGLESNLLKYIPKKENISSTFFIKYFDKKDINDFVKIENKNFLLTDGSKKSYDEIITKNNEIFYNGLNLFLFDIHDYDFIFSLLKKYNFNYIYFENYKISDENFINLIDFISIQKNKFYKINFISININDFQLEYLLNNFPLNITFIEISLNKIANLEKHLLKLIKNENIIFEQCEIFRKLIK